MKPDKNATSQSDAFKEAARALECDESEQRFNEALGKVARHKPKSADKSGVDKGPQGDSDEGDPIIKAG